MSAPKEPLKDNSISSFDQPDQEVAPPPQTSEVAQGTAIASTPDRALPREPAPEFKVGKRWTSVGGQPAEVFTLTRADETIELLPLKNWSQLDVHKWRARGLLPGTPTGLEIALDHVKLSGEEFYPQESNVCERMEKRFAEWYRVEEERLELVKKQADSKAAPHSEDTSPQPEQQTPHFEVDVDKLGQVHIRCLEGKAAVATIGLTAAGFQSLVSQRLLRKPRTVKIGMLHDWVDLEGVLYSFQNGHSDADKLARALNEKFRPASASGKDDSIVIFEHAATATGLEIQFAARVGGVPDHHRRPLDPTTLELLQDADRCGLLQPGIVVKLAPPNVVFKRRTPDGGEEYLPRAPENQVRVLDENGNEKLIDLSQPLDFMRLSAAELTTAFNHPTINRIQKTLLPAYEPVGAQKSGVDSAVHAEHSRARPEDLGERSSAECAEPAGSASQGAKPGTGGSRPFATKPVVQNEPPSEPKRLPNLWLRPFLDQPALQHEWFIWLVYRKIADLVGNSQKAKFDQAECWLISLNGVEDPVHPGFKGIFLVENCCLGFLSPGYVARFEASAMVIGPQESVLKAADVRLLGAGTDRDQRFVFIVSDGYREKFGLPEQAVAAALAGLKAQGAIVAEAKELLGSREPIDVVWTVPAEQAHPSEPQAVESTSGAAALRFPGTVYDERSFARRAA